MDVCKHMYITTQTKVLNPEDFPLPICISASEAHLVPSAAPPPRPSLPKERYQPFAFNDPPQENNNDKTEASKLQ